MDIERINTTLDRAILGLQSDEIEAMVEAMAQSITSFNVPPPSRMRSSYRPPSPASMGFVPGKKKKGKALKWKKKTIKLYFRDGEKRSVPGLTKGVWGVHPTIDGRNWTVTHIPSSMSIRQGYTKAFCQEVVDTIADERPEFMNIRNLDKLQKSISVFLNIFKSAEQRIEQKKAKRETRKHERLERDMALEPSVMGTKSWKKAAFNTLTVGTNPVKSIGHIKGVWGVTKDSYGWKVIHLPSGLALVQQLRTKALGVSTVDEMTMVAPELLFHKSSKFSDKLRKIASDSARKARKFS